MTRHVTIIAALAGFALAVTAPAAAYAQAKPIFNDQNITVLQGIAFGPLHTPATPVDADHPLPATITETPAISTPQLGSVTSSAAIATGGTAKIAAGVATIGPLAPQLGRSIRVLLKGTWAGTVYVGTSADGCTTINPLTIGGQPWATFTGNANEDVDTPHLAGVVYCARATITSGTLTYAVRQ